MDYKDYYKTLGVDRDATQDAIKQSYRRLARKYHPDVSREANAEARFKEVKEAYEVLKDSEKRTAYDQFGNNWKAGQEFKPPPDWNPGFSHRTGGFSDTGEFSDFFESLFGSNRGWQENHFSSSGQDQQAKITLSLEDVYRGATRSITLQGSGNASNCRSRTLNVKIPSGVYGGQRIRLPRQGTAGMGNGHAGDLYLEVQFESHEFFRAQKRDIHLELPVTPWEAALGQTVTTPTLGGNVELKLPAGSQSGEKLRLKGKGLPGNPPGDQYIVLKIVTPEATTATARKFYEEMASMMPMDPRVDLK